jgi:hypothetical protein
LTGKDVDNPSVAKKKIGRLITAGDGEDVGITKRLLHPSSFESLSRRPLTQPLP